MKFAEGDWAYSKQHGEAVRIIEAADFWGHSSYRVFVPSRETIFRLAENTLLPLSASDTGTPAHVAYAAAAARVADALNRGTLLTPLEGNLTPLPHQLYALSRTVMDGRIRCLLADEVGLGKTIEAGLIMQELKVRDLVKRTLVVAPKALVTQWISEMKIHFREDFNLVIPGELSGYHRSMEAENLWRRYDQVVCPMDAVKPVEGRRGWTAERLERHNRERFGDLITAGWDLVIVDEAHRLGGSSDAVARFRLGEGLAEAAPYLLLLSATPHQGKTDAFHRLLWLLDAQAFPDTTAVTPERVHPYVIRTEKRRAIDADGKQLFKPRKTQLVSVAWLSRHEQQRRLYDAVTAYVREGYNQAVIQKRAYIGFLMLLMQRLVTSSTSAISVALEKRLAVLNGEDAAASAVGLPSTGDWNELDGQQQMDLVLDARLEALRNEQSEVAQLLDLSRICLAGPPDAKAECLLDWMYRLQQEEADPSLKFLIFTEFVPTQDMLRDFLVARGFNVTLLNGSMELDERLRAQCSFAEEAHVMISTDAGGEGLNLQFCHVVINYDLPWNPMRIEQRIGRVDRIGQAKITRALNLVLQDTVEHRVREVLETKLRKILDEFGIDKTSDVLDSAEAEESFDALFVRALINPEQIMQNVDTLLSQVRTTAKMTREGATILGTTVDISPEIARNISDHPFPKWIERMTVSYLQAAGGSAERDLLGWRLRWPDEESADTIVFTQREASRTGARLLSLEDRRVRVLAINLPRVVRGQPVPIVRLNGLPDDVRGTWSLWRIVLWTGEHREIRVFAIFLHDDGRSLAPTAVHLWDRLLLEPEPRVIGCVRSFHAGQTYDASAALAQKIGSNFFSELSQHHKQKLERDRAKLEYSISHREEAIKKIGLPAVRSHKLAELHQEAASLRAGLEQRASVIPELNAVLLIRVESTK
jgi:superfamily II DNA or RNA helicase